MFPAHDLIVPTKLALLGIVIGAVSGLAIAQLKPGPTLAAVVAHATLDVGKALDTNLLKLDGDYFAVSHTPDVSMTPQSTTVVRKIGYGQTRFVTIAATSTGTYSSDGLGSSHVRYPGIYSERLHVLPLPWGNVLGWSRLGGWVKIPLVDAGSIAFLADAAVPASRDGVCVTDNATGACR